MSEENGGTVKRFHKVKGSSNISWLMLTGTKLKVGFRGSVTDSYYLYENVSEETFLALTKAPSIGRAFNELIKSDPEKYPFKKIDLLH